MHYIKNKVFFIKWPSQENGRKMEKEDCGNTLMFFAIGASVVLSAVIHVLAVVIAYKRYYYLLTRNKHIVHSETLLS